MVDCARRPTKLLIELSLEYRAAGARYKVQASDFGLLTPDFVLPFTQSFKPFKSKK